MPYTTPTFHSIDVVETISHSLKKQKKNKIDEHCRTDPIK
jgi:hypothetical protein